MSRPALRAANVDVHVDTHGPLSSLFADPVQLELALLNLVSNSLDAMPGGGRLEILLSATADGVRLVVGDSGTGIPPDVLPRIFDAFGTTKPPGRGTGLGLSITRDAIASHGGVIDVRSEPGQGTVFTIDLPPATLRPLPRRREPFAHEASPSARCRTAPPSGTGPAVDAEDLGGAGPIAAGRVEDV